MTERAFWIVVWGRKSENFHDCKVFYSFPECKAFVREIQENACGQIRKRRDGSLTPDQVIYKWE